MSEKVIINKPDMVELANEIRSKAGKTNSMNLKQLKNAVSGITGGEDVSAEVGAYTTELAELTSAVSALEQELQGKAAGGSGGGSVNTCTVTMKHYPSYSSDYLFISIAYSTIDSNGNIVTINKNSGFESDTIILENVVCNTPIYAQYCGIFAYQGNIVVYGTGTGFRVFSAAADITIESQPTG
jgi:hypothetical protein